MASFFNISNVLLFLFIGLNSAVIMGTSFHKESKSKNQDQAEILLHLWQKHWNSARYWVSGIFPKMISSGSQIPTMTLEIVHVFLVFTKGLSCSSQMAFPFHDH